jgi:hypothetical protein
VWLAPPYYGQRVQVDVNCLTYHDLVFSGVGRAGPTMCLTVRFNAGRIPWRDTCAARAARFNRASKGSVRYRLTQINAGATQQHFPFCWTGGHGTEPYEQNTQQSPGLSLSRWPQPLQS